MVIVLFQIFYYMILARILLSFFPVNPYSSPVLLNIVHFLHQMTEPLLRPFRSLVPPLRLGGGYLDLSPILAIMVLSLLRRIILGLL